MNGWAAKVAHPEHDPEKWELVFRKGHAQAESVAFPAFLERVTMRNALGLMLASVVAAVVIAGVWFWTSAPRADAAAPAGTASSTAAFTVQRPAPGSSTWPESVP